MLQANTNPSPLGKWFSQGTTVISNIKHTQSMNFICLENIKHLFPSNITLQKTRIGHADLQFDLNINIFIL